MRKARCLTRGVWSAHQIWHCHKDGIPESLAIPIVALHGLEKNAIRIAAYQARGLSQNPSMETCWNCSIEKGKGSTMICNKCGYLQDITKNSDYFELFSFRQNFTVDGEDLTKRFRRLQTLVHPDKFANKSEREKTNSAEWSALINKAYKTLSKPIDRGQYILKLRGQQISTDNSALDKEFLMEMMERNEEVDSAESNEELTQLNDKITHELNAHIDKLQEIFDKQALDVAKSILVKMKYLQSIQNTIKAKLNKKLGI